MTFQQMYDYAMVLWDKAGSAYMPKDQFDVFANIKYDAWQELMAGRLEEEDQTTNDLMYLFVTITKNNSNVIDRVIDVPNFYKQLRFNMTYTDPCKPQGSPPSMSRIYVATNDEIDDMLTDSFNRPTDEQPAAVATQLPSGNAGWLVYSTTAPLTLNMTYVKNQQVIDSANNPNTLFEGPDHVAYILIQLVVYRLDITIENLNRMKAEAADISTQLAA